jgi:hypothetical protein
MKVRSPGNERGRGIQGPNGRRRWLANGKEAMKQSVIGGLTVRRSAKMSLFKSNLFNEPISIRINTFSQVRENPLLYLNQKWIWKDNNTHARIV